MISTFVSEKRDHGILKALAATNGEKNP